MMEFLANTMKRMGIGDQDSVPESPNSPGVTSMNKPLAHMDVVGKYNYSTLEYPSDIQSRTDLGHYMMFYVNVPIKTAYSRTSSFKGKGDAQTVDSMQKMSDGKRDLAKLAVLNGAAHSQKGDSGMSANGKSWKPGVTDVVIKREKIGSLLPSKTKRTSDSIVLYMPSELTASQAADYKSSEVGGTVGQGIGVVNKAKSEGVTKTGASNVLEGVGNMVQEELKKAGGALISGLSGGDPLGAFNKLNMQAQNNFLEAMFTGIGFRKFSYTFQFRPKNPKEVVAVKEIIKTFKFHMAPEVPAGNAHGRYFVVPAEFDIFYMFRGEENEWVNKIATSVLVNCDLNYAPNGYQTFRPMDGHKGAPPTEIDMKLDFMETKIITKAEVLAGY